MILSMPLFAQSFQSNENEVPILIIENKKYYQKFIADLLLSQKGAENEFSIYVDGKELNLIKEMDVIMDFFQLELNYSKNLTKLYQYIKTEYVNEKYYMQTSDLLQQIMKYIDEIMEESEFSLSYDHELDISTILKAINLQFYCDESSCLDVLIDYVRIMSGFFNKKIFVLTQFKHIFTEQEQELFYQYIAYHKIEVLLLESLGITKRMNGEIYRIIDEDHCVIY
ncbi:MAG: type II-A CRISPR-associated protein Csn2 [Eubacteriales bacterium]